MGRELDWSALPVIIEYLGLSDVDNIISSLIEVKDYADQKAKARNG